jgi:hypothetical protein
MLEHDDGNEQQQETMAQFLSRSIADIIVYLTPPDYEGPGTSPSLSTESLATISNLSSLEFDLFTSRILARDP